jgi:hypothetical protein
MLSPSSAKKLLEFLAAFESTIAFIVLLKMDELDCSIFPCWTLPKNIKDIQHG